MSLYERLLEEFERRFSRPPVCIVRAPARVQLFGGTEPQQTHSLVVGIDRSVWIALEPRDDGKVLVHNIDIDQQTQLDVRSDIEVGTTQAPWSESIRSMAGALRDAGFRLEGWQGIVTADSPPGRPGVLFGALQLATARVFSVASGFPWDSPKMAAVAVASNSNGVLPVDKTERLTAASAKHDCAVLIDHQSLGCQLVPLPADETILLMLPEPQDAVVSFPAPVTYSNRENQRALAAADALRRCDLTQLHKLFAEGQQQFLQEIGSQSPPLQQFVDTLANEPGCHAARITQSSFGVVAAAFIKADCQESILQKWKQTGSSKTPLVCHATDGAEIVDHLPRNS